MKVVIIEDEQLLANELQSLILDLRPDWSVLKIIHSVAEGVSFFKSCDQFDLIFSDIQLGDGLSFQIFQQTNVDKPIIFCTAFNQYALEAFKHFGIDYLLKPFDLQSLLAAIQRLEKLQQQFTAPDLSSLFSRLTAPKNELPEEALLVRHKDKIIPLTKDKIGLCHIRNGLVFITDMEQNRFPASETMDELEQKLGSGFYRVDRQHLVNRKAIRDVSQHLGRKLGLNLHFSYPEPLLIRKEKATDFLHWLSQQT